MRIVSLALIIVTSAHALIGMEVEKIKPSPITFAQTYYYFTHDLLLPEITQHIYSLQLGTIDPTELSHEIKQSYKNTRSLVEYINVLINACGPRLASELCERLFPSIKVPINIINHTYYTIFLTSKADLEKNVAIAQIFLKMINHKELTLLTKKNLDGMTALHKATNYNNTEIIKLLLNAAGDEVWKLLTHSTVQKRTALHYANSAQSIQLLLDAAGDKKWELMTIKEAWSRTILHEAAYENHIESIQLLLEIAGDKKWELIIMQDIGGWTSLHRATYNNSAESIMLLLDAAGDKALKLLAIKDNDYKTAFKSIKPETKDVMQKYMTTNRCHIFDGIKQSCKDAESLEQYIDTLINSCGSLLTSKLCKQIFPCIEKSIDVIEIIYRKTFLDLNKKNQSPVILQMLLKIAGNKACTLLLMQEEIRKRTALHSAILNDEIEIVQLLLDAAGDNTWTLITMQSDMGWTTLHRATVKDNTKIIKLLLGAAGNQVWTLLTMKNNSGSTALHLAADNKNTESIKLLLDAADDQARTLLSIKNKQGNTAFDLADSETKKVMMEYMTINLCHTIKQCHIF